MVTADEHRGPLDVCCRGRGTPARAGCVRDQGQSVTLTQAVTPVRPTGVHQGDSGVEGPVVPHFEVRGTRCGDLRLV